MGENKELKNQFSEIKVENFADIGLDDWYFVDMSHLNYWGANVFIGLLNVVINN